MEKLEFQIDFLRPMLISASQDDYLQVFLMQSDIFKYFVHPEATIDMKTAVMTVKIPQQFPKGIDSQAIVD